ncbi:hypothetical protein SVI_0206 [Shewanella violacea DSS12]|uniref:Uncharacterized protein n=1 Tax=Shewanella violacea (strain JCM 10179 / CIP 106290 / LMG 19151 / DSS12) TaxID=637905 RepID=D4ZEE7_SHEVD|nr:hypothetical protein SVI_0206 [Shewanella violacea DSS12]
MPIEAWSLVSLSMINLTKDIFANGGLNINIVKHI